MDAPFCVFRFSISKLDRKYQAQMSSNRVTAEDSEASVPSHGAASLATAEEDDEVTVLGEWPSPAVRLDRARVALRVKGARHPYVEEELVDRTELLVTSNPAGVYTGRCRFSFTTPGPVWPYAIPGRGVD
ncbi:hypothetical protein HU200_018489 [Digitaria exilis]|uniref:Uncharacterized protein n=1 Tax=Digitaria exilis TaxID=1010633 RepID=A0A835F4H6_9POAL|nr:hypothetical protein HU200_018489 [Digitaria exilis]